MALVTVILLCCVATAEGRTGGTLLARRGPSNVTEQIAEVQAAVEEITQQTQSKLEDIAVRSAAAWVGQIRDAVDQSNDLVRQVGEEQTLATRTAIQAEKQAATDAVQQMRNAVETAQAENADVRQKATDWATARAQHQVARFSSRALNRSWADLRRVRSLRPEATASTGTALRIASRMVEVAKEADKVAALLARAREAGLPQRVAQEDREIRTQAAQAERLSKTAAQVVLEANALAKGVLEKAIAAEARSMQALASTRANALRIDVLKSRVQSAHEMADSAAEALR